MEPYYAGVLSILPPILAVALALITKEVFSSLLVGILSGTFIYCLGTDQNPFIGTAEIAFKEMAVKFDLNIVIFCCLLGSLVYVISIAGGARAYGKVAAKAIRGRRKSMLATSVLGGFIFIDDYFNCLTVGTVMRPITDSYKVSRAKLAYIIDTTAAPICIIAPISSWAAAVGSNLKETNVFDNEIAAFVATIPWNFYALLSLAMVFLVCFFNIDFGPMKSAEIAASNNKGDQETAKVIDDNIEAKANGTIWDMIIPIVSLIVLATAALLYVGGYWGDDESYHTIGAAFGNTDAGPALVLGSFGALLVACALFVGRGLLTLKVFMDGVLRGVQTMLPACLILTFAWTISGVCRDLLQTPEFISTIVKEDAAFVGYILPAVIFVIAGFLSFSTGTAWGTFGILIPIVVSVAQAIDPDSADLIVISLSATLAGSVFGDHCSPISDTTILSSAGAGCVHIEHVYTQLPYSLLVASCAIVGYIIAGITSSLLASLGTAAVMLLILAFVVKKMSSKKSD